jgi:hypothetical protein
MVRSQRSLLTLSLFAAAGAAQAQTVLFDAGPPNTSFNVSTGAPTLLGWSSGNLPSAGFPQRWAAQGFVLSSGAQVTDLGVYGFDPLDATNTGQILGFTDFHWIIFRRVAGNPAPTTADILAQGSVPAATVGQGQQDPRWGYANQALFHIPVNVSLAAGNYWLTVYGENPVTPGADANFAWFTNAQLDITLTPPNTPVVISDANGVFMWRSSSFPSPGFQRYTTPAFTIDPAPVVGPIPQDPQYLYNAAFTISGTAQTGPTCYPNCDNSTTVPFLNVLDFNCFVNAFGSGQSYANCDNSTTPPVLNVLDFNCFVNAFSGGCSAP